MLGKDKWVDLACNAERLEERIVVLEGENSKLWAALSRAGELVEPLAKLQDLVCEHAEVRKVTPFHWVGYNEWKPPFYLCCRCGKTMDAKAIGEAELEKRIKKEG